MERVETCHVNTYKYRRKPIKGIHIKRLCLDWPYFLDYIYNTAGMNKLKIRKSWFIPEQYTAISWKQCEHLVYNILPGRVTIWFVQTPNKSNGCIIWRHVRSSLKRLSNSVSQIYTTTQKCSPTVLLECASRPALTLILLMWRTGWANSIRKYIQQDATLHSLFISGNCSTCFGW
jgi:hypothetical protein